MGRCEGGFERICRLYDQKKVYTLEKEVDVGRNVGYELIPPEDIPAAENYLDIERGEITVNEFEKAIKQLKDKKGGVGDRILRNEQAGFRKGGCNDQIFVVRHVMQQANELKVPLSLCFLHFEKAFDSV
nr:uncharacterized protein LOC113827908 [Penaeus vannamei]